jgi:hypothetical protein
MIGGVFAGRPAISPPAAGSDIATPSSIASVFFVRGTDRSMLNLGRLRLIIAARSARVYKGM